MRGFLHKANRSFVANEKCFSDLDHRVTYSVPRSSSNGEGVLEQACKQTISEVLEAPDLLCQEHFPYPFYTHDPQVLSPL